MIASAFLSLTLCYIVWSQAFSQKLSLYEFSIEIQPDGTQKFVCRLKSQEITKQDTSSSDSDDDTAPTESVISD